MKKSIVFFSTLTGILLMFSLVVFLSCNKGDLKYNDTALLRPCDNVICLNGGTCVDGLCNCPLGFEGTQCATKWSDRFVATYNTDDECDTSQNLYSCVISADPDYAYKLRLYNVGLNCQGVIMNAVINPEKTSFAIPVQKMCNNLYMNGYGNINGNFVNIYLHTRDSSLHTSTQCSLILSKQ